MTIEETAKAWFEKQEKLCRIPFDSEDTQGKCGGRYDEYWVCKNHLSPEASFIAGYEYRTEEIKEKIKCLGYELAGFTLHEQLPADHAGVIAFVLGEITKCLEEK